MRPISAACLKDRYRAQFDFRRAQTVQKILLIKISSNRLSTRPGNVRIKVSRLSNMPTEAPTQQSHIIRSDHWTPMVEKSPKSLLS
jgi:hypothetical protein